MVLGLLGSGGLLVGLVCCGERGVRIVGVPAREKG